MSQTSGSTLTEYLIDQQPSLAVVLRQKIGSDNTHYIHGLRGIASQHDGAGWSDAVSDGLGSVRGWLNSSQTFTDTNYYDPYGVPDASVVGYGFTGEMTDANRLVYLRARYYDPSAGVFASLDPFEGVYGRPMSVNGYSWVEGNVANKIDPTGRDCESWHDLMYGYTGGCLPKNPNCSPNIIRKGHCLNLMNRIEVGAMPSYEDAIGCYTCNLAISLSPYNRVQDYRIALENAVADGLLLPEQAERHIRSFAEFYGDDNSSLAFNTAYSILGFEFNGYSEAGGSAVGALFGSLQGGYEMAYNFATFQRMGFTFRGGGGIFNSSGISTKVGISISRSAMFINGFTKHNRCQSNNIYSHFESEYSGETITKNIGGSLGVGGGYILSNSPDGSISGAGVYLSNGLGIDLGVSTLTYTKVHGTEKSYINYEGKVNIAELASDIRYGPNVGIGIANMLLNTFREEAITMATYLAEQYNNSPSAKPCSC